MLRTIIETFFTLSVIAGIAASVWVSVYLIRSGRK